MLIGVPREIKPNEHRVAIVPAGVEQLVRDGHTVMIETDAGVGSGFSNDDFISAGATIADSPNKVYGEAEMIVKVKEPITPEWELIREDQLLFTYFHFAASRDLTQAIVDTKSIAIAYETVELPNGSLPLLVPMSEIAGRMATQEGAKYLEKTFGGRGVLLGGVPGTPAAEVVVLGGGIVGTQAAKIACGFGANVHILDTNLARLRYLDDIMPANCNTVMSSRYTIREYIWKADLIIGSVLIKGAKAPWLITREMLKEMRPGTVIVDVSVDQGGCVETSRPTTHHDPIYTIDGIVHYGVANMPGAVPHTSTIALTNATLPYVSALANKGFERALFEDNSLRPGLNIYKGNVAYQAVAEAFDMEYWDPRNHLEWFN